MFIHEQMHWWLDKHPQQTEAAVNALRSLYKTLPVDSAYLILIKNMPNTQLWIEPLGNIIVARLRGEFSAELLRDLHERVVQLLQDTGHTRVLYDGLEMESPDVELALVQQQLDRQTKQLFSDRPLRKAILVPNTRLAYLARIAFGQFGEGEYRVFYNDLTQALRWLDE